MINRFYPWDYTTEPTEEQKIWQEGFERYEDVGGYSTGLNTPAQKEYASGQAATQYLADVKAGRTPQSELEAGVSYMIHTPTDEESRAYVANIDQAREERQYAQQQEERWEQFQENAPMIRRQMRERQSEANSELPTISELREIAEANIHGRSTKYKESEKNV